MEDQQTQLIARLKEAQNVLVTVSKDPSVDQLAAAIGLTLALNKYDKHATAVFSGRVPSTIQFLKPEETLEKNTDSLRDFIIALDKSKADKLRYKVEDEVVRIFITPYRTSISEKDLDFSQGDFNVDVVIAIGVEQQSDLDAAILAHGRILHDATVSTLSISGQSELGTLNLANPNASSLSEMVAKLVDTLDHTLTDAQIATALLTGIVATTDRFSNERTTPETMSISASLMSAGANQQLISTELAAPVVPVSQAVAPEEPAVVAQTDPGTLEIDHDSEESEPQSLNDEAVPAETPEPEEPTDDGLAQEAVAAKKPPEPSPQISVDAEGKFFSQPQSSEAEAQLTPDLPELGAAKTTGDNNADMVPPPATMRSTETTRIGRERVIQPPSHGGDLTANTAQETLGSSVDELTLPPVETPMLSHTDTSGAASTELTAESSPVPNVEPVDAPKTDLDQAVLTPPEPAKKPDDWLAPTTPAHDPLSPLVQTQKPPQPQDELVAQTTTDATPPPAQQSAPAVGEQIAVEDEGVEPPDFIDTAKQTLQDIEQKVGSTHTLNDSVAPPVDPPKPVDVDDARDAVEAALRAVPSAVDTPDPIVALNAQSLGQLHGSEKVPEDEQVIVAPEKTTTPSQESPEAKAAKTEMTPLSFPNVQPDTVAANQPPSVFPGVMPSQKSDDGLPPPPPVPPPPIPM
jgi:hypothetical protein